MKTYLIDRGCKLCDACFWACPVKAIYIENNRANINQEKCIHCGVCYSNCPNEAITIIEEKSNNQQKCCTN
jgi:pyruvate formate lyase activating enzyme